MKNFSKIMLLAVIAVVLTFGAAFAKEYNDKESGLSVNIPDDWKVSSEGNVLEASAGEDINLIFETLKADDVEAALTEAEKALTKELGELKTEKTAEVEINGMKAYIEDCTAKEGKINVSVMLLATPGKKMVLLYYIGTPEAEKKYEAELTAIVQSLKPATTEETEK